MANADLRPARSAMLQHLRANGITSDRVLTAMETVARDEFVPEADRARAYEDTPLAIGFDQTISQPLMVALLVQALDLADGERVLDIGTGSGFQAAVLAACNVHVISVEIIAELAESARDRLYRLKYTVDVRTGDGGGGLDGEEPFDAIAVAAAAPEVPVLLVRQLAAGGRLVVPIRETESDRLTRITRTASGWKTDDLGPCRFVPLRGEEGIDA